MRTQKGYEAPWSSRRETAGLMGTFLVFLFGLPSHSETLVDSTKHMVRQLVQLVLVFLGLSAPTPQIPVVSAPAAAPKAVVHHHKTAAPADPNSMLLRIEPVLHHYQYIFKGIATLHNQPFANASVLVRLSSGDKSVAKGTVTEADGSYSLDVAIDAEESAPVDWSIEAYTPDFQKVELAGRQIVQSQHQVQDPDQAKDPIIVTNPVEFIVSLSK